MNSEKGNKLFLIILITISIGNNSYAQDEEHHKTNQLSHGFHRLTGIMGNAFLVNSFSDQAYEILIVPAFGLTYDYIFKKGWGLGLHTDIMLQQFKAESHGDEKEIIRENPIALVGMLLYKPHHRWTLMAGYGIEFEKNENLQIIRIGGEYGIELPKNWELGFTLEFDFKPDAYNSLLFGIGFSKIFHKVAK